MTMKQWIRFLIGNSTFDFASPLTLRECRDQLKRLPEWSEIVVEDHEPGATVLIIQLHGKMPQSARGRFANPHFSFRVRVLFEAEGKQTYVRTHLMPGSQNRYATERLSFWASFAAVFAVLFVLHLIYGTSVILLLLTFPFMEYAFVVRWFSIYKVFAHGHTALRFVLKAPDDNT